MQFVFVIVVTPIICTTMVEITENVRLITIYLIFSTIIAIGNLTIPFIDNFVLIASLTGIQYNKV